ncbi:hypothetical protein DPMN_161974 [Dreissena polymorpha]|uniref:Uncharacterized protein n=1 Tax=Dreissena polymorpha TaxID=45954 RepID=A0A9D4IT46_DREPO|nr:hypothetical protein DPMN_161974 [Dreissena polymorpha]
MSGTCIQTIGSQTGTGYVWYLYTNNKESDWDRLCLVPVYKQLGVRLGQIMSGSCIQTIGSETGTVMSGTCVQTIGSQTGTGYVWYLYTNNWESDWDRLCLVPVYKQLGVRLGQVMSGTCIQTIGSQTGTGYV